MHYAARCSFIRLNMFLQLGSVFSESSTLICLIIKVYFVITILLIFFRSVLIKRSSLIHGGIIYLPYLSHTVLVPEVQINCKKY